jgi:hypothetical protein
MTRHTFSWLAGKFSTLSAIIHKLRGRYSRSRFHGFHHHVTGGGCQTNVKFFSKNKTTTIVEGSTTEEGL